jgi:hypothetical protein
MAALESIALFSLGAIASALVSIYLSDTLRAIAARTIGRAIPRHGPNLRGPWVSTYDYPHEGARFEATQLMAITQNGAFVHARRMDLSGSTPHRHDIRLRIEGEYATGVWRNTAHGATHFGAVQLKIAPNGDRMKGRWVGFDSSAIVQGGEWEWTRQ